MNAADKRRAKLLKLQQAAFYAQDYERFHDLLNRGDWVDLMRVAPGKFLIIMTLEQQVDQDRAA